MFIKSLKKYSLKKYSFKKGFTVLETIFAIVIFSFALISLMGVASKSIVTVNSAREEMIATYLNQEAIEAVRWWHENQRMAAGPGVPILQPGTMFDSCGTLQQVTLTCYVSFVPSIYIYPTFDSCTPKSCPPLFENNGSYHTNPAFGGQRTPFSREIYLQLPSMGNPMGELLVQSTVYWKSRGIQHAVSTFASIKDY